MPPCPPLARLRHGLNSRLFALLTITALISISAGQAFAAACTANSDPAVDCDDLVINTPTSAVTISSGVTVHGSWAVDTRDNVTTLTVAGGISATDRAINNNSGGTIGTVDNSGLIEAGNRAFENALGSSIGTIHNTGTITAATILNHFNGQLGTFDNSGTVAATNTVFENNDSSSIGTISNTGTITAGSYVLDNEGSVTTILNSGEISGSSYSVYNDTHGYIGTISNTGSFGAIYNKGKIDSIYNTGDISMLVNGQGGSNTLDYSGVLPDAYNILISSPTTYGQLSATAVTSKTAFGISNDSTVKATTYTAVLTGLTSGNLVSTSGVFNDYDWTLTETGTGTNIWNLILTCSAGHTCAGGPTLDLLQSVLNQGGPGTSAARVLNTLISGSPSGDMGNVASAFSALSGDAQIAGAVNQTLPTLTGGTTTASLQTLNTTSQIVQARQEGLSGLSTGDGMIADKALWLKPFGTWSDQGGKNGIAGYSANTAGLIGGMDGELSDAWRVGGAFSYAHTNVDGDDGRNGVDVDAYQAIGYGSYKLDATTEANLQAGLGMNRNDSNRKINFGGIDRNAEAGYNSYSMNVGAGIGQVYTLAEGTRVVPSARMDYTLMRADDYTETGAGGLNLDVKAQTVDQLIPALQVKFDQDMGHGFSLSANAGAGYDVLNSRSSVTSSYVGGGAAFITEGLESSPWVVRSGLGLTYAPNGMYDVSLRYDREDRGSSFDTQTASVKVRVRF